MHKEIVSLAANISVVIYYVVIVNLMFTICLKNRKKLILFYLYIMLTHSLHDFKKRRPCTSNQPILVPRLWHVIFGFLMAWVILYTS